MGQTSQNDGVRLQLSQIEVKPSSGRETPNTSFADTLGNGLGTGASVVANTATTAGYSMVPGAAVLGAAITSAGAVKSAAGSNGGINGGGMTGMYAYGAGYGGGGMGMGGMGGMGMGSNLMASYPEASMGALGSTGLAGGTQYSGYMGNIANRAAGGDANAQTMMATQQMQEMNQAFNLQYLQLQEKMQQEGREFTALSNVMKAKNDTAKNSLSNLK